MIVERGEEQGGEGKGVAGHINFLTSSRRWRRNRNLGRLLQIKIYLYLLIHTMILEALYNTSKMFSIQLSFSDFANKVETLEQ